MTYTKRICALIISFLLIMSVFPFSASALTFSDGTFKYEINDDYTGVILVDCESNIPDGAELVIPEFYNNLPVLAVADEAFFSMKELKLIKFSKTSQVKTVGAYAFINCSNLESVELPASVTSIGDNAFLGCASLATVTVAGDNISVGKSAFYNCNALTSFDTKKVSSFGESAFRNTGLESVYINENVTEVPEYCFAYCDNLNTVAIRGISTVVAPTAFYREPSEFTFCVVKDSLAMEYAKENNFMCRYFGDVSGDGRINISDVTYIQLHLLNYLILDETALICANVNNDDKVNVRDVSHLQIYLADYISVL